MKKSRLLKLLLESIFIFSIFLQLIGCGDGEHSSLIQSDLGNLFTHNVNPGNTSIPVGTSQDIILSVSTVGKIALSLIDGILPPFIRSKLIVDFNPDTITAGVTSIMTITVPPSVAPGTYDLLVKFKIVDSPGYETSDLTLTVASTPGFSFNLAQNQINLEQGSSDTVKINILKDTGFNESISFNSNTNSGITPLFSPQIVQASNNSTDLIISADAQATSGDYQLIITGTSTISSIQNKDTLQITITEGSNLNWEDVTPSSGLAPLNDVYFPDETIGYAVGNSGTIIKSADGGQTWQSQNSSINEDLYSVNFLNSNFGFAVGHLGTILRTTNGGSSWDLKNAGSTNFFNNVFILDQNNIWVAGSVGGGYLYYSSDGGENWVTKGYFGNTVGLWFNSNTSGLVLHQSGNQISSTYNGGDTWLQVLATSDNLYDVCFIDTSNGFACGGNGAMYTTNDGGSSWMAGSVGIPQNFYSLSFSGIVGFAVGGGTVIKYDVSNWLLEETGLSLSYKNGVSVLNSTNVIVVGYDNGEGRILRRK